jgi:hypothetical protein
MSEWPTKQKYTHGQVDYSQGDAKEHCGKCRHFIAPDRCEHVASPIRPAMWCKLYAPKE